MSCGRFWCSRNWSCLSQRRWFTKGRDCTNVWSGALMPCGRAPPSLLSPWSWPSFASSFPSDLFSLPPSAFPCFLSQLSSNSLSKSGSQNSLAPPRRAKSETVGWGNNLCWNKNCTWFCCTLMFKNHWGGAVIAVFPKHVCSLTGAGERAPVSGPERWVCVWVGLSSCWCWSWTCHSANLCH